MAAVTTTLRRLAPTVLAGAIVGASVGGVGSRLAMMSLAALNPGVTGVRSDDGFRIGQFTLGGTASLVLTTLLLGAVGGLLHHLLRPLLIGPSWFRLASMSLGPGVVVGAVLVHVGGVDFRLLDPPGLAVALFVAVPTACAGALLLLADRWQRRDAWPARVPAAAGLAPLLLLAPLAVVVAPVAVSWLFVVLLRRIPPVGRGLAHPATAWLARAVLAAVFVAGAVDLTRDVLALA